MVGVGGGNGPPHEVVETETETEQGSLPPPFSEVHLTRECPVGGGMKFTASRSAASRSANEERIKERPESATTTLD